MSEELAKLKTELAQLRAAMARRSVASLSVGEFSSLRIRELSLQRRIAELQKNAKPDAS
jgi:hypothetical protein